MKSLLIRLWKEEEGQDITEYALLLVLIALVAAATLTTSGNNDLGRIHQRQYCLNHHAHSPRLRLASG